MATKSNQPKTQIAEELGITFLLLYRWRRAIADLGQAAFKKDTGLTLEQQEIKRLRLEIKQLETVAHHPLPAVLQVLGSGGSSNSYSTNACKSLLAPARSNSVNASSIIPAGFLKLTLLFFFCRGPPKPKGSLFQSGGFATSYQPVKHQIHL